MKDVYQRLAEFLDTFPQRYPLHTESGIELKVLRHIFSPEDAETVMKLTPMPETAAEVAARIGEDPGKMERTLFEMSHRGQIFRTGKPGSYKYMATAFLVGIIEFQMNRMTPELARDMAEFGPILFENTWMKGKTRDLRTIPIAESVDSDAQVMPYESAEEAIRSAKYIGVSDCMCRRQKDLLNEPCSKPVEVCFHFGSGTHYFVENGMGRYVGQEEALAILKQGQQAGLVCQLSASQNANALCMCCDCCCGPLIAYKKHDRPSEMVNSSFFARVSEADCIGCDLCEERCPMDAISMDDVARVNLDRCIGCGVCAVACPTESIKVFRKDKDRQFVPESDLFTATMAIHQQRRET